MKLKNLYRIEPRGPFHFGRRGVGIEATGEFLHSDTLFGAIASAWRALGGKLGRIIPEKGNLLALLAPFQNNEPPFRISSVFPYAGDLLFLPRPKLALGKDKNEVLFLSAGAWEALCHGRTPSKQELIQDGRVWVTPEERERLISLLLEPVSSTVRDRQSACYRADAGQIHVWTNRREPPVPRVSVDRLTSRTELYHQAKLHFAAGCGLYFWAEFTDEQYQSYLEEALTFLEDGGLGGRRTTGHGQFRYSHWEAEWPEVHEPTHQVLASVYHPSEEEMKSGFLEHGAYELVKRGGWITPAEGRAYRHRGLWMLSEGSVFPIGFTLNGTVQDVRPKVKPGEPAFPHPVLRCGFALTLPIKLEEDS